MTDDTPGGDKVRLQVFLSRSGLCSRRKAMDLIFRGWVSVNGQVVREPSYPVTPGKDEVLADGQKIGFYRKEYILLNKPGGYTTTKADPFAEKTVFDLLPSRMRALHPVGRLDKETEGLLLLTNDGPLTFALTHPRHRVDKTYLVRITGTLTPADREKMEQGILLEGRQTARAKVAGIRPDGTGTQFTLTIHEGRKRQVRLMLDALGYSVVYLKRLSLGPLALGDLKTGGYRPLTSQEVEELKRQAEDKPGSRTSAVTRPGRKRMRVSPGGRGPRRSQARKHS